MSKETELHEDFRDFLLTLEFKVGHLHKHGKVTEDDIDKLCDVMDEMSAHWRKVNKEQKEKKKEKN